MQISKSYFVILSLYFLNDMIKVVIFYHLRERGNTILVFFYIKKNHRIQWKINFDLIQ